MLPRLISPSLRRALIFLGAISLWLALAAPAAAQTSAAEVPPAAAQPQSSVGLTLPEPPPSPPPPPPEFRLVLVGPMIDFGFGSSQVGYSLLGNLGGAYIGIRSFRSQAWLLQWDLFLGMRAGMLATTRPYIGLAGMYGKAAGELGYRFLRRGRFGLYVGGGLAGRLTVMTKPGTPLDELNRMNNLDGVAGVVARGDIRVDTGLSFLDGTRSLLVLAVFQEALRAPGMVTPGAAFSEGGIAARFDLARRLTTSVEVLAGQAPPSSIPELNSTSQTAIVEFSAYIRGVFRNGMWLAGSGGYSREFDRRSYADTTLVYRTANAPTFYVTLHYGVSLDRHNWRGSK